MPYVSREARKRLEEGDSAGSPGELNYVITRLVDDYVARHGGVSYTLMNEVVGILECAKLELYRRVVAPYEDMKLAESGDVYQEPAREGGEAPPRGSTP